LGIGISAHNVRNHANPLQWLYPLLSVSEKDSGTRLYQALLLLLSILFLAGIQNRKIHFFHIPYGYYYKKTEIKDKQTES
jgi:hypothetical protein